ncbi:MAG: deoxyribodipyrimidine photo-lyase [Phycisphaerae bacterium]|nr:deoxyribodipyrimidine photo-lyase [Phycisphaerae bacterium]
MRGRARSKVRSLVWFRSDLRARDNTALHAAAARATRGVIGLYVISPGDWARHDTAPCRVGLVLRNLAFLSAELAQRNIPLLVRTAERHGDVGRAVVRVASEFDCDEVHFNEEYPVNERQRDAVVADLLASVSRAAHAHADDLVFSPDSIRTAQGRPYTVFTPFKRAWIRAAEARGLPPLLPLPRKQHAMVCARDAIPDSPPGMSDPVDPGLWPAGEAHACRQLGAFLRDRIVRYERDRNEPAIDGTSRLSPQLAAGVISARQCLHAAVESNDGRLESGGVGPITWISELIWREFYRHILIAFPRVSMNRPFRLATDGIRWSDDERKFEAWRQGRTGIPLVDAAMRALTCTGWMHNRLRMITAMYLTKDLFIDWRWGERHFMRHLVDGDLASNNGGWQWSASTGTDAAPYFRVFNPVSQSRAWDPKGVFIRRWLPELRALDDNAIHDPSGLPPLALARLDYPAPIVDHARARERAIAAFRALAGG